MSREGALLFFAVLATVGAACIGPALRDIVRTRRALRERRLRERREELEHLREVREAIRRGLEENRRKGIARSMDEDEGDGEDDNRAEGRRLPE